MSDQNRTAIPSGISKHIHSSNTTDAIISENLYSEDTTSKNKGESYQTLEGQTVPAHTDKKINPFHVQGVPGCKSCGGSGWKESAKHPHPCNECAKKTVPNIDTYLTKVGQTATPVSEDVKVEKTIPVTEYVEQRKTVPVTSHVEVTKEVPVSTRVPVVENVNVIKEVPVTRLVEKTKEIPVTRTIPYTENVHIHEKVPRTTYEDIIKEVPTTRTREETTTIPVKTVQQHVKETEIIKESPMSKYEIVSEQMPHISEYIPGTTTTETIRVGATTTPYTIGQGTITYTGVQGTQDISGYSFKGLPDCKHCLGEGIRKSLTGKLKPCKYCVKATGNCPMCRNTGWRNDNNKKCDCVYAK
jgi:hypothetical protein